MKHCLHHGDIHLHWTGAVSDFYFHATDIEFAFGLHFYRLPTLSPDLAPYKVPKHRENAVLRTSKHGIAGRKVLFLSCITYLPIGYAQSPPQRPYPQCNDIFSFFCNRSKIASSGNPRSQHEFANHLFRQKPDHLPLVSCNLFQCNIGLFHLP